MTSLINWKKESRFPSIKSVFPEFFGMENFFEEPGLFPSFWENRRLNIIPATNIRETDQEFILELAAPGMEKKDFFVDVRDDYPYAEVQARLRARPDRFGRPATSAVRPAREPGAAIRTQMR